MLRDLNGTLIAVLIVAFPAFSFAADARTEHTITDISTLASDCTTYFSGDADAFNAAIAKLASEYPSPPATVGEKVVPNITVSIFKGTGKAYLTESMMRQPKGDESIICHVPPIPREVISGQLPAFAFDWIVIRSATKTDRQVTVMLFAGGVDLFDCVMPQNVSLKIAKPVVVTTTPVISAKLEDGR